MCINTFFNLLGVWWATQEGLFMPFLVGGKITVTFLWTSLLAPADPAHNYFIPLFKYEVLFGKQQRLLYLFII